MSFPQFHRPIRSGVLMEMLVRRLSLKRCSVSIGILAPGTKRVPLAMWNCCSLVKLNPGDQVSQGAMFTADGVRLMLGKLWLVLEAERSCLRVPPMFNVPQENLLSKFRLEPICAVTSQGLSELRWMSDPFVE